MSFPCHNVTNLRHSPILIRSESNDTSIPPNTSSDQITDQRITSDSSFASRRRKREDDISKVFSETQDVLNNTIKKLSTQITDEKAHIDAEKLIIAKKLDEIKTITDKLTKVSSDATNKIKLNIGGTIFTTTLQTLTHEKGNFFPQC